MADIKLSEKMTLRVQKTNFKGKDYIDIRKFYVDDKGELKPTKKGVTYSPEVLNQVVTALQSLIQL